MADILQTPKSDHQGQVSRLATTFSSAATAPKSEVIGAGEAERLTAGETAGVGAGECSRFDAEAAVAKVAVTRGRVVAEPSALKAIAGPHLVFAGDAAAHATMEESTVGVRPK
jgi:hypothetical protein